MYTLEIAGIAIATTDADEAEAREIFESEDFLDDIRGFTSAGARFGTAFLPSSSVRLRKRKSTSSVKSKTSKRISREKKATNSTRKGPISCSSSTSTSSKTRKTESHSRGSELCRVRNSANWNFLANRFD